MDSANTRILFNAQAFGFGPSAAIAAIAPHFLGEGHRHAYAGTGHSLDLQWHLPYGEIHDLTHRDERAWAATMAPYDVVVTAMDTDVAERALSMGKRVVFYDALTWYWHRPPFTVWQTIQRIVSDPSALYLAQDFHGVRDTLESMPSKNWCLVPPLIPRSKRLMSAANSDLVLLNLGGLQNAFIEEGILISFARHIAAALRAAVPAMRLRIATSKDIASALGPDESAQTYPPDDIADMLGICRFAVCSPGLGNIYEAAATGVPAVWLPPANATQGLQLEFLRDAGLVDAEIRWESLGESIDFGDAETACLARISHAMRQLSAADRRAALHAAMRDAVARMDECVEGRASRLLQGRESPGGAQAVAASIRQWLDR